MSNWQCNGRKAGGVFGIQSHQRERYGTSPGVARHLPLDWHGLNLAHLLPATPSPPKISVDKAESLIMCRGQSDEQKSRRKSPLQMYQCQLSTECMPIALIQTSESLLLKTFVDDQCRTSMPLLTWITVQKCRNRILNKFWECQLSRPVLSRKDSRRHLAASVPNGLLRCEGGNGQDLAATMMTAASFPVAWL